MDLIIFILLLVISTSIRSVEPRAANLWAFESGVGAVKFLSVTLNRIRDHMFALASYPGSRREPGTDCLRMREKSQHSGISI